jgi:hypothetical protein
VDSPYYSESELCGGAVTVSFQVPPLASDALLTTLHPLLEIVLQTVDHFEISCLGAPVSWLEKPRNLVWRELNWILCSAWKKWIGGTPLEHPPHSPYLAPLRFLCYSTHEMGPPRQEVSKCLTVCSTFSRSGWSVVRSASLANEVLQKRDRNRTSTKSRLGVTGKVHELFKRLSCLGTEWRNWNHELALLPSLPAKLLLFSSSNRVELELVVVVVVVAAAAAAAAAAAVVVVVVVVVVEVACSSHRRD